jgi:hypothetical protein
MPVSVTENSRVACLASIDFRTHADDHLPFARELDCVTDEIYQDLPQANGITDQIIRSIRPDVGKQLHIGGAGTKPQNLQHFLEQLSQWELNPLEL